jgi:hypothetical protein
VTKPDDWSVRIAENEPTGFGDKAQLALETYDRLVQNARTSGEGGSFALIKNGEVVGSAIIPMGVPRKD